LPGIMIFHRIDDWATPPTAGIRRGVLQGFIL